LEEAMILLKTLRNKIAARKFHAHYIADQPVALTNICEFRAESFPLSGPACWLDQPDGLIQVDQREQSGKITPYQAEICRQWIFDGYIIVKGLIDHAELDETWAAYERAIAAGVITVNHEPAGLDDPHPGRRLDPHLQVPEIRKLQRHKKILELTDLLFGRRTLPFQTIMGHKGSSQSPHSDTIHMTTHPHGYLIANWIAFEDIDPDSGPLEFYPGSHRLIPPLLSHHLSIGPGEFKKNPAVYHEKYEPAVRRYLEVARLEPELFLCEKGDVLFWHADLIHGGARRRNMQLSRKALVCHYFAQGALTYHDLSGNLTRLHRHGPYAPPVLDET
jgi:ectoine hydroxylase-related dioxygenase (phytanoyl-CoA dioxygenase family)